jgi:hypothetical protein
MNLGLVVGIVGFFAVLFLREYFFGGRDSRKGFPWSRRRRR